MQNVYKIVGANIRARRLKRGLTLEDLSELSDLHVSFIGLIERNQKKPSLQTIATLANALSTPLAELFQDSVPIKK